MELSVTVCVCVCVCVCDCRESLLSFPLNFVSSANSEVSRTKDASQNASLPPYTVSLLSWPSAVLLTQCTNGTRFVCYICELGSWANLNDRKAYLSDYLDKYWSIQCNSVEHLTDFVKECYTLTSIKSTVRLYSVFWPFIGLVNMICKQHYSGFEQTSNTIKLQHVTQCPASFELLRMKLQITWLVES